MNPFVKLSATALVAFSFCLHAQNPADDLEGGIRDKSRNAVTKACAKIAQTNDARAAQILCDAIKKVKSEDEDLYWIIIRAMASFTNPDAISKVKDLVLASKGKPLSRDILYAFQSNSSEGVIGPFSEILKKGSDDLKIMVVDHFVSSPHKDCIPALIDGLEHSSGTVKNYIIRGLKILSGQDFGDKADRWKQWWEQGKDKFSLKKRKSGGGDSLTDVIDPIREDELEKTKKIPPELVVVVKTVCPDGRDHNFDRIERTLDKLGIPHIVVNKDEFEKDSFKMDGRIALLWNCNQFREHCICPKCKPGGDSNLRLYRCTGCNEHKNVNLLLSDKGVKKIKDFVEKGGYLFTEDWGLEEILVRAWKEYVATGAYQKQSITVTCFPAGGAGGHPYMKGIFGVIRRLKGAIGASEGTGIVNEETLKEVQHKWVIDDDSPVIKVVDPKKVAVLMTSPELENKYKDCGATAITFIPGSAPWPDIITTGNEVKLLKGGRVVHVLSHFGKQSSTTDEFSLQNLLLNFMLEAIQRYQAGQKK